MIPRTLIRILLSVARTAGKTVISPMLEKKMAKTVAVSSPLVLSMSRVIALAFAAVMLREVWHSGIEGWPDATLGIATVLALPIMNAIDRASPDEVVALTRVLLARMGGREPSLLDDHRQD